MGGVTELKNSSASSSEGSRRWFTSATSDLIVWYEGERIRRFEFCYDKTRSEHAFVWKAGDQVRHLEVDDGEQSQEINYKESPIYVPDGDVNSDQVQRELSKLRDSIPTEIYSFVEEKVLEYANDRDET